MKAKLTISMLIGIFCMPFLHAQTNTLIKPGAADAVAGNCFKLNKQDRLSANVSEDWFGQAIKKLVSWIMTLFKRIR